MWSCWHELWIFGWYSSCQTKRHIIPINPENKSSVRPDTRRSIFKFSSLNLQFYYSSKPSKFLNRVPVLDVWRVNYDIPRVRQAGSKMTNPSQGYFHARAITPSIDLLSFMRRRVKSQLWHSSTDRRTVSKLTQAKDIFHVMQAPSRIALINSV